MLEKLLRLDRPLFIVDCETTSLDTQQARIIELAFQMFNATGLVKEYRTLVNPGVPIPDDITKLTHISEMLVQGCRSCDRSREAHLQSAVGIPTRECEGFRPWPTFKQIAESLAKGFRDCDYCGQNVKFDLRIIATEFARVNIEWSLAGARIVDSSRLEALGEPRHLSNLYEKHTGRRAIDAHQALADVRMTTDVIVAQLQKYQTLPRDLDALHALQFPGMIDLDGKFKFIDGVPCFGLWGKYAGKTMEWVATNNRSYYEFILKEKFSPDVKTLARQALAGVFPERT